VVLAQPETSALMVSAQNQTTTPSTAYRQVIFKCGASDVSHFVREGLTNHAAAYISCGRRSRDGRIGTQGRLEFCETGNAEESGDRASFETAANCSSRISFLRDNGKCPHM
jgi:hypothetical protein